MDNERIMEVMIQYQNLLKSQNFNEEDLDYEVLDYHKSLLDRLDVTGTSCISIFDLFKQRHIYMSSGYHSIIGLDADVVKNHPDEAEIDARMHPDDQHEMTLAGMHFLQIAFALPVAERKSAKLVAEYRIRNKENKHVRVIEQFQAIELDRHGNVWLALCFMDISPNQDLDAPFRCRAMNFATGTMMDWETAKQQNQSPDSESLSRRENEILGLIATGMMSKEIAEKLFISVHTVNTHRQRILEKLGAGNSHEAIVYGRKLGLIIN